jgi:hypothetical protein
VSAEACGCDPEAQWVCKQHRDDITAQRAAWARTMARELQTMTPHAPLMMADTPASRAIAALNAFDHTLKALIEEREHIASVLADFYRAPISMSSLQPILDLAVEMNP